MQLSFCCCVGTVLARFTHRDVTIVRLKGHAQNLNLLIKCVYIQAEIKVLAKTVRGVKVQ